MSPSMEPFNEEKYKALMDGLDFEEILKSEVENSFTLGAEYYGKKYVSVSMILNMHDKKMRLGDMWTMMTDGDHGSPDYREKGVLYLLSENVQAGYIDQSKCRFITEEKNVELKRSCLHPGDIVVTKTGAYFGKSAVVPPSITEANTIAHVGKITLKPVYNPYYVSTFLNCKYGYYQLRRRGIKATRPEIKLVEFPDIVVPIFSEKFDDTIEKLVCSAGDAMERSSQKMKEASGNLLEPSDFPADFSSISVRNFSESFAFSGRLDAEYYQPKYENYTNVLHTGHTVSSLCILNDRNFVPEKSTEYLYIELANVGMNGDISGTEIQYGRELPSRARRRVKTGQVIVSSVEGSLQSCALITEEYDGAICSTGFYVLESDRVNAETLLILFKSKPVQALMKQRCSGTILTAITKEEFLTMPLPEIDRDTQKEVARKVQESFALRKRSKRLLAYAKRAVEIATEQDEERALGWLKKKAAL